MKYAPIVLFVYNRADHAKKVVNSLLNNPEAEYSDIFIFSDAAKDDTAVDGVDQVRKYIRNIQGFGKVSIIERKENWGIEKSEIEGITTVIKQYGRVIVIEDDIEVAPCFLKFVNDALEKYKNEEKVYSITGYSFIPSDDTKKLNSCGFIQLSSAWGWATWKDRWETLKTKITKNDINQLFKSKFRKQFDYGFIYSDMMIRQVFGGHITWDILWYWTSFINSGMTLVPSRTLVNNIGMDGTGVHYCRKDTENRVEELSYNFIYSLPEKVEIDTNIEERVIDQLKILSGKSKSKNSYFLNFKRRIKWFIYWIKINIGANRYGI